jgi:hypothetical protein
MLDAPHRGRSASMDKAPLVDPRAMHQLEPEQRPILHLTVEQIEALPTARLKAIVDHGGPHRALVPSLTMQLCREEIWARRNFWWRSYFFSHFVLVPVGVVVLLGIFFMLSWLGLVTL